MTTSTTSDRTTDFARRVLSGAVVAGPSVRAACQRHLTDLLLSDMPDRPKFNREAADRAFRFFEQHLRLSGGQFEKMPFLLHESQAFKIGSIYGWQRPDGTRRFRRVYIEEAKGNGKTPLAAGIGHYGLVADGEPRAEIYAAASSKDQAMVLFRDACSMRDMSESLAKSVNKRGGNERPQRLFHMKSRSFFVPVSPEGAHSGLRPSVALLDELHEHRDRNTYEMLARGVKSRRQPLVVMITNSGFDKRTVCWDMHEHAIKVATGQVEDDEFFSYVCDLDEGDDPFEDESCWIKVNPLLGTVLSHEYLRNVVKEARQQPGSAANIKRLHFCIWTEASKGWLSWNAVRPCLADFDPFVEHAGKEVNLGWDLAETEDLAALGAVVQTGEVEVERIEINGEVRVSREPTFDAWVEAWTPVETARDRARRDRADYPLWIEQGHLHGHPGKRVRLQTLAKRLVDYQSVFSLRGQAYDRYCFNTFDEVCGEFNVTIPSYEHPQGGKKKSYIPLPEGETDRYGNVIGGSGRESVRVEKDRQALWMPNSKRLFEQAVMDGRIRMRNNPALVSAILSAAVSKDEWENQWLVKRESTQRIDPVVALVMALGLAYVKLPRGPSTGSYLTHREIIVV